MSISGWLAILVTLCVWSGSSANALELRLLASWDNVYPARSILLNQYIKNVEAASKGDITFKVSGPETVPPFEQLQPVGNGVFDMLFSHSAYHAGNTPYLLPIDGLTGDTEKWRKVGLYEKIDSHYQRFGLKLLALPKAPDDTGYQFILREPVSAAGDLGGRKIRATQSYAGALSALKASPVVLPPAEIYTALEKGVVDGAGWPSIGVIDYRWYEVAKYLMRPMFGAPAYCFFINLNTWKKLTDAQRNILLEEGRKVERSWPAEWMRVLNEEEAALKQKGMKLTEVGAEQRKNLSAAFERGLWDFAASKDAKSINELHEFTKKAGISN